MLNTRTWWQALLPTTAPAVTFGAAGAFTFDVHTANWIFGIIFEDYHSIHGPVHGAVRSLTFGVAG